MYRTYYILACILLALPTTTSAEGLPTTKSPHEWISLFNGNDLSGWTVKITGHPLGQNFGNTFRVEDGILKAGAVLWWQVIQCL